jgi:hypothetical protein
MPDYIPAFTGRGLSYERMGDAVAARREFEKALASQSHLAHLDYSKSSLETAQARIAALDSGAPLPVILPAPRKAESARIALVIGNSAYRSVVQLTNPQNDAHAIGTSLQNIGFDNVTIVIDTTRDNLREALHAFADEARNADWAMVYYAGHGVELSGIDYLVPVDARIARESDAPAQAIPLPEVIASLEGARKLKLVLLDACRDNPFEAQAAAPAAPVAVASTGSRTMMAAAARLVKASARSAASRRSRRITGPWYFSPPRKASSRSTAMAATRRSRSR